jgi:hypothetical protein
VSNCCGPFCYRRVERVGNGNADVLFLFWPEECTFYDRSLAL